MCLSVSSSLSFFFFSFFFCGAYDSTKERHASIGRSVDFYPSMHAPFHKLAAPRSIGRARRAPDTRPSPSRRLPPLIGSVFFARSLRNPLQKRGRTARRRGKRRRLRSRSLTTLIPEAGLFFPSFLFFFFLLPSPPPPSSFFSFFNLEAFRPSLRTRDAIVSLSCEKLRVMTRARARSRYCCYCCCCCCCCCCCFLIRVH